MTTTTDTQSVPDYQSRYSDGWCLNVMRLQLKDCKPTIVFEAYRTIDGVCLKQEIRLTVDAAQALGDALDALLYGPPQEVAA